jgi:hypothetical protein
MDAYLRRLQREASQGDPEDIRRYIAALERVIGQADAPWYLDENYILRAHDIHGQLKEFFEDDD